MYSSGRDRWFLRVPGRVAALTLALALILPLAPVMADVPAPVPLAPADGATTVPSQDTPLAIPEFRWSAVAGATVYRLQFANNAGMAAPFEFTTANTSYTPVDAAKFTDGSWFWRVKVDKPTASQYSAVLSFAKRWADENNRPLLSEPLDGATLAFYGETEFSWQPVLGAASYRLQIAASPDGFGSPLYNAETLAPVHQPAAKRANGTYYWRVIPYDAKGRAGVESMVRSFVVSYNQTPALIEPPNGPTTFTPTFRWTAVQGAEKYTLEYATDAAFTAELTRVTTNNASYTPEDDLKNDVNYYWRVCAVSGSSVGPWSEVRKFVKQWYLQPVLLTPTDSYQYVHDLFFSWTPVPGARGYRIEIHDSPSFPADPWVTGQTSNPYYWLTKKIPKPGQWYYWRVIPLDANGNMGEESKTASFQVTAGIQAPQLVSPLYYYVPNAYGPGTTTGPTEDRTAAYPLLVWQRVVSGSGQAAAYRLQVSSSPLFTTDLWQVDTVHLWATPTAANPFNPRRDTDYYWRVIALDAGQQPVGEWSQVWRARFDASRGSPPAGPIPVPLRPADGSEWAETAPYLEWRPVEGAAAYDVRIARDRAMTDIVLDGVATWPVYAPHEPLFYSGDPATALPYGTWYWQVRVQGAGDGGWSPVQRFQIAAGSHWSPTRTPGAPVNRWQIASDPAGDAGDPPDYDLTRLDVSQSQDYWVFGFPITDGGVDRSYVLYLDLDHVDGSGATTGLRLSPSLAYDVTTVPSHQPEYAIHVPFSSGTPQVSSIAVYPANAAGGWGTPTVIATSPVTYVGGYLEIQVPTTVIAPALGRDEKTSSLAVSLFSAGAAGGPALDSVPSDPGVPGAPTVLSRLASVTERMTAAAPANLAAGEDATVPSVPPFFWNLPLDVLETSWHGYRAQAAVDDKFTTVVVDYTIYAGLVGRLPYMQANAYDFDGDNTYYWRVRPLYTDGGNVQGAWSEPFRFERQGFVPTGLSPAGTEAAPAVVAFTPRFQWDLVEGAQQYDLQVSTDKNFGSTTINVTGLARNQYTWSSTLAPGTYHWRVRIRRMSDGSNAVINDWSPVQTFTVALPVPAGLRTQATATLGAPTLCWDPLVVADAVAPTLAAWKYRVQISRDATFTTIWDTVDTEQACWTPTKGYHDGDYWWRVAMIDGAGRLGAWSGASTFRKAYPLPTGLSQSAGAGAPTFRWAPVPGAAAYRVEVSVYSGFNVILDAVTTNTTCWTPTKAYTLQTTWYWRVAMIDKDDRQGSAESRAVPLQNPVFLPRLSMR